MGSEQADERADNGGIRGVDGYCFPMCSLFSFAFLLLCRLIFLVSFFSSFFPFFLLLSFKCFFFPYCFYVSTF